LITLVKSQLYKKGGLEKYTWQLAYDFCQHGARVALLTTGKIQPPFSHPLLHIVSFPIDCPLSVLQLIRFDKACSAYLKAHPTEIVFSLDRTRFATHIRAGNGVHAQYLRYRRSEEGVLKSLSFGINPLHRMLLSFEKRAFENPRLQLLFANSHMVRKEILDHYALDPQKIAVMHNGVEWHQMQASFDSWQDQKPLHLRAYGLDPSAFQFLFIGHNYRRKGLDYLLNALSLIRELPFQLSVLGKEKKLSAYQRKAKTLGLENKVFFFGPSQDILPFYQLADALAIPSLYDPFANVTVEALAMGLFVISSKTNGGCEVLNRGSTPSGIIIPDLGDTAAFAASLKEALAYPKEPSDALAIRRGVEDLDFSRQLRAMTEAVLKNRLMDTSS
jgi:UDP-glucose:(heptosyl)LPS alpha-1,3-glucosyltransferase